jgi:hypothetical protein
MRIKDRLKNTTVKVIKTADKALDLSLTVAMYTLVISGIYYHAFIKRSDKSDKPKG